MKIKTLERSCGINCSGLFNVVITVLCLVGFPTSEAVVTWPLSVFAADGMTRFADADTSLSYHGLTYLPDDHLNIDTAPTFVNNTGTCNASIVFLDTITSLPGDGKDSRPTSEASQPTPAVYDSWIQSFIVGDPSNDPTTEYCTTLTVSTFNESISHIWLFDPSITICDGFSQMTNHGPVDVSKNMNHSTGNCTASRVLARNAMIANSTYGATVQGEKAILFGGFNDSNFTGICTASSVFENMSCCRHPFDLCNPETTLILSNGIDTGNCAALIASKIQNSCLGLKMSDPCDSLDPLILLKGELHRDFQLYKLEHFDIGQQFHGPLKTLFSERSDDTTNSSDVRSLYPLISRVETEGDPFACSYLYEVEWRTRHLIRDDLIVLSFNLPVSKNKSGSNPLNKLLPAGPSSGFIPLNIGNPNNVKGFDVIQPPSPMLTLTKTDPAGDPNWKCLKNEQTLACNTLLLPGSVFCKLNDATSRNKVESLGTAIPFLTLNISFGNFFTFPPGTLPTDP